MGALACSRRRPRVNRQHRPGHVAPALAHQKRDGRGDVFEWTGVLQQFGVELPEATRIRVWDSTAEIRYLVIPERPEGTDGWSEAQLADLVTRDSMIGAGLALSPGSAK